MSVIPPDRSFSPGIPAGHASPIAGAARIFRNRSVRRTALAVIRPILNPLMLGLTRSKVLHFAVVQHRGRRSGRVYATPVAARPIPDGFVVPLTFGEQADWFRNVQAAGGCVIAWKGAKYPVVEPKVIDRAAARAAFTSLERVMLALMGMENFVLLRHAPVGTKGLQTGSLQPSSPSHRPSGDMASDQSNRREAPWS
jgi:deazaflavin-dependent oxidoreductase (nitroreductase family)